jgi:hypothetical protein
MYTKPCTKLMTVFDFSSSNSSSSSSSSSSSEFLCGFSDLHPSSR